MATPPRAKLSREEPDAGNLHVRVCEGWGRRRPHLLGTRPCAAARGRQRRLAARRARRGRRRTRGVRPGGQRGACRGPIPAPAPREPVPPDKTPAAPTPTPLLP